MATRPQLKKVLDYIEIAKADGAFLAAGGTRVHVPGADDGFFVAPTIFTGVSNDMRIAREEVFGPILSIIQFDTDDEAAEIANDTEYGLAAGIWTKDLARAINFPKRLEAGTVWVNAYRAVSYMAPFGGFKSSGIGRENGVEAIKEYLETRSVFINTDPTVPDPFKMR
jgi:aldehyde dehydrogenase (NAD+)